MKTRFSALILCIAATSSMMLAAIPEANAVPVFARKYHTTCFTCHTTPPLLNDFGLRFQANGYELPGTIEKYAQADQPSFLMGVVAQPMFLYYQSKDNLGATPTVSSTSFSGVEVGLFTSASLGNHLSFYMGLPIDYFSGAQAQINVETANLIYTDALNDGTGSLNFRLGEFRFSIPYQHQVILANPDEDPLLYTYDAFTNTQNGGAVTPANRLSFSDPNFGISAFGMIPGIAEGLRYDIGYSGGTNSDIDLKQAHAIFGALNQTFYVNNAPLRIGAFYYGGSQLTSNFADTMGGVSPPQWTNNSSRVGLNLEIYDPWTKRLDFYGQYLTGKDDNVDTAGTAYNMTGSFVGVNVIIAPEKFYVYGRYDIRKVTETSDNANQIDVGFQYHLLPNAFVTGDYTVEHETTPQSALISAAIDQTTTWAGIGVRFGF
ncbi:MAG TPA: hypothetical protein VFH95_07810 [Candidatus Kapabacteria bacterium]|nr:hypothetical protein [Candidatus Kapabacteria bacterium]